MMSDVASKPIATPAKKTRWAWAVATFFGAGYLKPGPGTYGSVAAVLIWFALFHFLDVSFLARILITLSMAAAATAIGIPASTIVARESGRKDPGFVVIDEVAGQWLALAFTVPLWPFALMSLLFFRFFDIFKPWPIRKLEQLPGGTGIVLDDLGAGVYALIAYWIFYWIYTAYLAH
jgi:phosphatidylglycerophosphatase A